MVRRLTLLFLAVLLVPGWAGALGIGEINLSSRLNQPLQAEIPLYAVRPNDVEGMKIALASAAQFRRAGVERLFYLTRVRFAAEDTGDGTGRIRVTTDRPVNEPFLNFLVEVDWPTGRLVREFTLLLDPPVYGAAVRSTVATAVPNVAPRQPRQLTRALASESRTAQISASSSGPFANRNAGLDASNATAEVSRTNQTFQSSAGAQAPRGSYGPVKRTDTLWSLALRLRPDPSISVHQMMTGILNANPQAFINGNINALRAGSLLNVPTLDAVRNVNQRAALAEIRKQTTAWEDVRRQAAASAVSRPATGPVSGSTPAAADSSASRPAQTEASAAAQASPAAAKASSEAAVKEAATETVVASAPADLTNGTLKIVGADSGDAPGGGTDAGIARLSDQVDLVREELDLSRSETNDLKSKLDQAESIILDMERLAQIRDAQLAQLQQQLAQTQAVLEQAAVSATSDATPAASAPTDSAAQVPVAAADATGESTQAIEPAAPKPPVAAPPALPLPQGIVDQAMAMATMLDPSILLGFGGAILAVLGLGWYRVRTKKQAAGAGHEMLEQMMLDKASAEDADHEASQVGGMMAEAEHDLGDPAMTAALFDEADTQTVTALDDDDAKTEFSGTLRVDQLSEDDPLQEANVYLAYERFDQAEDVVKGAIEAYPDRLEYRVKLLEIYRGMRNRAAFDEALVALQESVSEDSELLTRAKELAQAFPEAGLVDTGVGFDRGFGGGAAAVAATAVVAASADTSDTIDARSVNQFDISTPDSVSSIGSAGDDSGTNVDFVLDSFDLGPDALVTQGVGAGTDVDFDLDFGEETQDVSEPDGAIDTVTMQEVVSEAFEMVQLNLNTVEGNSTGDAADQFGGVGDDTDVEALDLDISLDDETSGNRALFLNEVDQNLVETVTVSPEERGQGDSDVNLPSELSEKTGTIDFDVTPASDEDSVAFELDFDDHVDGDMGASANDEDEAELTLGDDLDLPAEIADAAPTDDADELMMELDAALAADDSEPAPQSHLAAPESADEKTYEDLDTVTLNAISGGAGVDTAELGLVEALDDGDELDFDLGIFGDELSQSETDVGGVAMPQARSDENTDLDQSDFDPIVATGRADSPQTPSEEQTIDFSLDQLDDLHTVDVAASAALNDGPKSPALGPGAVDDEDDDEMLVLGNALSREVDAMQTKLDLAQEFAELGDSEAARDALQEVIAEGDNAQQQAARALLDSFPS
jgi:pilus assembly protein FimV